MPDKNRPSFEGDLVTKAADLTLSDLCESCDLSEEIVTAYVAEGIIEAQGGHKASWRFSRVELIEVRRASRLERDLGVNTAGAALALDLMNQIKELKERLAAHERDREND